MRYYFIDKRNLKTLAAALGTRLGEELRGMALLFVAKPPQQRIELIKLLIDALDGDRLRKVYDVMKPLEKAACAETVHDPGGQFQVMRFQAKYGDLPKRHDDRQRRLNDPTPYSVLDLLLLKDFMPRDILRRMKEFVPPPQEDRLATVNTLPAEMHPASPNHATARPRHGPSPVTVCATELAALHDVASVLRLIDSGKLPVSPSTRRHNLAGVRTLLPLLRDGDFVPATQITRATDAIRAFAWPALVENAGLAKASDKKLVLTNNGHEILAKPAHETIKRVWEAWARNKEFDEFVRIDSLKLTTNRKSESRTSVDKRRQGVIQMLAACPPGQWIDIDEFFRYFQSTGPEMVVSYSAWELKIAGTPLDLILDTEEQLWSILEGRYIMCLLWEYAATLGLVDVAHIPAAYARADFHASAMITSVSRYDGLRYFRLTPLGAYCLGTRQDYEASGPSSATPCLKVLPNHEIVLTDQDSFQAADALLLDRVCTKPNLSTWRLDKPKILNAMHEGFRAAQIEEFLAVRSTNGLPENVKLWIHDTLNAAMRVSDGGKAHVFVMADAATALHVLHDKSTKGLCYAAGETRVVVPAEHLKQFRQALKKMGYVLQARQKAQ